MGFNYSKLSGRIKEKCSTQTQFAQLMGLSERTVSMKMSGKRDWRQKEIANACLILDIEVEKIPEYFFTVNVQN
ncbi:MAG: DUF739 family protein [Clostridia bacterium]|nr:DUF739 family protein [Clostridia bacterium]MCI9086573.1 DUF739 family protein [Clostridia bacterium]